MTEKVAALPQMYEYGFATKSEPFHEVMRYLSDVTDPNWPASISKDKFTKLQADYKYEATGLPHIPAVVDPAGLKFCMDIVLAENGDLSTLLEVTWDATNTNIEAVNWGLYIKDLLQADDAAEFVEKVDDIFSD